jgi:hypothetical protein
MALPGNEFGFARTECACEECILSCEYIDLIVPG